jgi:hypothetical protein
MKGWLVAVLVAMVVAVACQNESPSPPPNHSAGVWLRGSQPMDPDVARTGPGPAHCGDQDSIFLVIGWPLGTAERNTEVARWYVRNPSDFRKDSLLSHFAADVIPPKDVRYTGYTTLLLSSGWRLRTRTSPFTSGQVAISNDGLAPNNP